MSSQLALIVEGYEAQYVGHRDGVIGQGKQIFSGDRSDSQAIYLLRDDDLPPSPFTLLSQPYVLVWSWSVTATELPDSALW